MSDLLSFKIPLFCCCPAFWLKTLTRIAKKYTCLAVLQRMAMYYCLFFGCLFYVIYGNKRWRKASNSKGLYEWLAITSVIIFCCNFDIFSRIRYLCRANRLLTYWDNRFRFYSQSQCPNYTGIIWIVITKWNCAFKAHNLLLALPGGHQLFSPFSVPFCQNSILSFYPLIAVQ